MDTDTVRQVVICNDVTRQQIRSKLNSAHRAIDNLNNSLNDLFENMKGEIDEEIMCAVVEEYLAPLRLQFKDTIGRHV